MVKQKRSKTAVKPKAVGTAIVTTLLCIPRAPLVDDVGPAMGDGSPVVPEWGGPVKCREGENVVDVNERPDGELASIVLPDVVDLSAPEGGFDAGRDGLMEGNTAPGDGDGDVGASCDDENRVGNGGGGEDGASDDVDMEDGDGTEDELPLLSAGMEAVYSI